MLQSDLFTAEQARDEGMATAISHANAVSPNWSDRCYQEFLLFIRFYPGEFMAETFREYCGHLDNLPAPPNNRAYGGVIKRAASEGLIVRVRIGTTSNPRSHMANASVWRASK